MSDQELIDELGESLLPEKTDAEISEIIALCEKQFVERACAAINEASVNTDYSDIAIKALRDEFNKNT